MLFGRYVEASCAGCAVYCGSAEGVFLSSPVARDGGFFSFSFFLFVLFVSTRVAGSSEGLPCSTFTQYANSYVFSSPRTYSSSSSASSKGSPTLRTPTTSNIYTSLNPSPPSNLSSSFRISRMAKTLPSRFSPTSLISRSPTVLKMSSIR